MILAIDLHHMLEVSEGGGDDPTNLIALCPTCHALFHRGTIGRGSIYTWKSVLVSLSRAFDIQAIDDLLFLKSVERDGLRVDGSGVLKFSRLIAADLASFALVSRNGPLDAYEVFLTDRGERLIDLWKTGNRAKLTDFLASGGQLGRAAEGGMMADDR
jgi:hypothetical protein